jgi:RNA polymerase sigma-70 factor (ECF subfamily)
MDGVTAPTRSAAFSAMLPADALAHPRPFEYDRRAHAPTGGIARNGESRLTDPATAARERRDEEAILLGRIVARDERAFEELHRRYAGPLYSLAVQVSGSDRSAQDIVQEVFATVWRDAARFDPERGAASSWLYSMARHKAIDHVRREVLVRRRTVEVDLELEHAPDDVHDAAWRNLRRDRVRAAMSELTALQRDAVELAFFAGLTHVEVAERLGVPLGTAKTRIRSGLLRLRDLLGDAADEVGPASAPGGLGALLA